MKNKIIYLAIMIITLLLLPMQNINAATYTDTIVEREWIANEYVSKKKGNTIFFQQFTELKRASDRQYVYCIEPGTPIISGTVYTGYDGDYVTLTKMSEAQWNRVTLLAYYGYGYKDENVDHTNIKWYVITQFMIWHSVPTSYEDIYFTDSLNGNRITKYTAEMQEMENLLANHYKVPSFNNNDINMVIGESITLTDTNNVLSRFGIASSDKVEVTKSNNKLTVKANAVGEGSITLSKNNKRFNRTTIVYIDKASQNIMFAGDIDPTSSRLRLNIVGGKIKINKTDIDTNKAVPQGEASLKNATYGVYTENDTKVGTITTDELGKAESDYLPNLGRFYVVEETPSEGYLLNTEKYYFNITEEELYPEINVYEKVITRSFNFIKVYANDKTGIMEPEPNIKFGIYNNNNEIVKELITDNQGAIKFELPYGTYTVKQLTTSLDHEKVEDFQIEVKETGDVVSKVLANAEIKAKLRVVKIDKETGDVIKRKDIKFKIFSIKDNDYVCQTTSYPQNKICVYETNEEGEFITPYVLSSGQYKLEEVDQKIDGYLWNNESHEFYIGEDSILRTDSEYGIIFDTSFENERVKGQIEITKKGETVNLTEEGYIYQEDNFLSNIKYNLYAKEDIYFNNKLIYKKDSVVDSKETNENGIIVFDNLYLGKYYIQEQETIDNYVLDNTRYEFELLYKDQYTPIIETKTTKINYLPKGKLEFTKTDFSTSETLPNTVIEIYTEKNQLVYSGKTDENGKIIIDKLPVGRYYILEKEAPEGYELNEEKMYFEIKENGVIVKATMNNYKIIEVPNTKANDNHMLEIIAISISLIGIGILLYIKKRK